jgi:hypothetical protein
MLSLLSPAYITNPIAHCRRFDTHSIRFARCLAAASAGNSNAAKIAMTAITTKSSINVKAPRRVRHGDSHCRNTGLIDPTPQAGQFSLVFVTDSVVVLYHASNPPPA